MFYINPDAPMWSVHVTPEFTRGDIMYLKMMYIIAVLYFFLAASTKLSILLMYNRLFSASRSFRRQLLVVIGLVAGWYLMATIGEMSMCNQLGYNWIRPHHKSSFCPNLNFFWMAMGLTEVMLDLVVLALPIPRIMGLQLSKGRRTSILAVFCLGGM